MKQYLLILFLLFLLFSCSKTTDNKEPWMLEETKQIISDYPDTLESSIQDAKKAKEKYDQSKKELEQQLQDIKQ